MLYGVMLYNNNSNNNECWCSDDIDGTQDQTKTHILTKNMACLDRVRHSILVS